MSFTTKSTRINKLYSNKKWSGKLMGMFQHVLKYTDINIDDVKKILDEEKLTRISSNNWLNSTKIQRNPIQSRLISHGHMANGNRYVKSRNNNV